MKLDLPCSVGDTVFAYLDDETKIRKSKKKLKKNDRLDLTECVVTEISIMKDRPEPLFTAICYEKALYGVFWLSEFGEKIFTKEEIYPALGKN